MNETKLNKQLFNLKQEDLRKAWGNPDSMFSGMYGDIYVDPHDENQCIGIYYDHDTKTILNVVFFARQR